MTIDSNLVTALRAEQFRLHTFAEISLDTGTSYLWDGVGDITYNSNTYKGLGTFGSVEFGQDKLSEPAQQFTVTLSGSYVDEDGNAQAVDGFADAVGKSLNDTNVQNRAIVVFVAVTDLAASQVLHTTLVRVSGLMDVMTAAEDDQGFQSIRITVEDRTLLNTLITPRRLGVADHQALNSTSTYLNQTAEIAKKDIPWGKSA